MILEAEHTLFQQQEDIRQICKPLFDNTPINYFEYSRYYKNGDFWTVNTNSGITEQYLRYQCYPDINEFAINTARYSMFSRDIPLPTIAKQAEERYMENITIFENFNVKHRLYIDELGEDYFAACGFGTDLDSTSGFEYFINNFDLFNKFMNYFLTCGKKIIDTCYAARIKLFSEEEISTSPDRFKEPPLHTPSTELPFVYTVNGIMLSKREYTCLQHMAHGKTIKEIAKRLSLSPKTVQTYIDRIKLRLGYTQKTQLIDLYWRSTGLLHDQR
jgi:DNA-binding CsgD family transcriptional regulator